MSKLIPRKHEHIMYLVRTSGNSHEPSKIIACCAVQYCDFELSEREIIAVIETQHKWIEGKDAHKFYVE